MFSLSVQFICIKVHSINNLLIPTDAIKHIHKLKHSTLNICVNPHENISIILCKPICDAYLQYM